VLCPSCGKEVAETDAKCASCGSSLPPPKPPSDESVPNARVAAPPGSVDHASRISGYAIASLILGLLPFVLLVPVFTLIAAFRGASHFIFWSYLGLVPVAAVLAIIYGRRVKAVNPRSAGRAAQEVMATLGRILGYIGLVSVVLFVAVSLYLPRFVSSSRRSANQFSTRASLREIDAAAATYAAKYGHGFPSTLAALGPPQSENSSARIEPSEKAAGLIDEYLAAGRKSFYQFTYIPGPADSTGRIQTYTVHADPVDSFEAGNIYYFTDQTTVIRVTKGREANQDSPPIQ
jgi:hypothetical protein